jgi:hypothetical protein
MRRPDPSGYKWRRWPVEDQLPPEGLEGADQAGQRRSLLHPRSCRRSVRRPTTERLAPPNRLPRSSPAQGGAYRLIYTIRSDEVLVLRGAHRSEAYRKL